MRLTAGQLRSLIEEAVDDRHNYVEEAYPEIKLALEELAGEGFVEEGRTTVYVRSAPQLWVHNSGLHAKEVAEVIKRIVELITASPAHVNRSGKTTRGYTIVVPKCITVIVDEISDDVRVTTFESYI